MKKLKIAVIGAASASFGPGCVADAVNCEPLRGGTLALVDLAAARLKVMGQVARRASDAAGAGLRIECTTDRREALEGADFVVTSIAVNRNERWKLDFEIPLKYSFHQVLGENGGPGGLFHTMRNVPIMLAIARDMELLCPEAILLNYTIPESRICLAVSRHTRIRAAGLCHGIFMGVGTLADIAKVPGSEVDIKAAGLNHFIWALSVRRRGTGEDLYPLIRERVKKLPPDYAPFTIRMFKAFGLFPFPSDDHIGEYLAYAWGQCRHKGYDFAGADAYAAKQWRKIQDVASGREPVADYVRRQSGESAFDIVRAVTRDENALIPAVNIPNRGCITNLPADAVVEIPILASAAGLQGVCVGPLPEPIAAMCRTQITIQELAVEAAVTGSRQAALQALLLDPVVNDMDAAEQCLDEMLRVHRAFLPQFSGSRRPAARRKGTRR